MIQNTYSSPALNSIKIDNRVALITGASSGIGSSTALCLAERGWSVWATTRNLDKCTLKHDRIHYIEVKLDNEQSIERAVKQILDIEGRVDALINNAAHMLVGTCEETSIEMITEIFNINVLGPIKLAQSVLPSMRERNYGRIINLSSPVAIQSIPGLGAFSASKAALFSFFQAMSAELLFCDIKITSLEIGNVKTPWINNCVTPTRLNVSSYDLLCDSLMERLKLKNETAEAPDAIGKEIAALLENECPPLRKAASVSVDTFLHRELIDVDCERYIQQQKSFLQKV